MDSNNAAVISCVRVTKSADRAQLMAKMAQLLGALSCPIPRNATVLVKVNLCLLIGPETGGTVDPVLVECLADILQSRFEAKEVIIAESDATHLEADLAFQTLGWQDIFGSKPNCRLLNLSKDERVEVPVKGLRFRSLKLSRSYVEADYLISFAKLKVHDDERMSCILKNQFGSNPEKLKIKLHGYRAEAIHDFNKVRMPDLCLVDGLVGMERKGPVRGIPKPLGLIIAGNDAVATDLFCCRLMGFRPYSVPHLKTALKAHLGTARYQYIGEILDRRKCKFAFTPWYTRGVRWIVDLLKHQDSREY